MQQVVGLMEQNEEYLAFGHCMGSTSCSTAGSGLPRLCIHCQNNNPSDSRVTLTLVAVVPHIDLI